MWNILNSLYFITAGISAPVLVCFAVKSMWPDFRDADDMAERFLIGVLTFLCVVAAALICAIPVLAPVIATYVVLQEIDGYKEKKEKKEVKNNNNIWDTYRSVYGTLDWISYMHVEDIKDSVEELYKKYKLLKDKELFNEIARNRFEYAITIISKAIENNALSQKEYDKEIADSIREILKDTNELLQHLIDENLAAEAEINKQVKDHLKNEIKKYKGVSKEMLNGLKEINKKG